MTKALHESFRVKKQKHAGLHDKSTCTREQNVNMKIYSRLQVLLAVTMVELSAGRYFKPSHAYAQLRSPYQQSLSDIFITGC